ncbi:MAG: Serine-type D-Ala-D-Ala carboxypeptidase [candidate division WS6 bacterium GW2011_GWF2_39_15]|uniref:Serine-type D-Ala-D-Ala carboxypeptidase n=1 Tax=candidate division WS6 bacterium GW2011_GWF2_39_15 TaxID=1619100 RepID=A0A0G0MSZ8_9BACT|nr:MAG: Serine-type D-Ala-D-Ala carboxypeptidase [candidate division WS6 bacterium GW2011_GWF2_39_15]
MEITLNRESKERRIGILFIRLFIPLLLLFTVLSVGLWKYSYIFGRSNETEKDVPVLKVGERNETSLLKPLPIPQPSIKKIVVPVAPKSAGTSTAGWWKYPNVIKETTRSGDDLLVLVNKEYRLPSTYVPAGLVYANTSGIRVTTKASYMLRSIVIEDLRELNNDAKKAGLNLSVISGYRSYAAQSGTYNYWVNYNGGNYDVVDQISARPGHSQHQLGTAMDFSSSEIGDRLGSEFTDTKAGKWLAANAWKYGFVISYPKGWEAVTGYTYESWHYRYIGRENAKEMVESGIILEDYLKNK